MTDAKYEIDIKNCQVKVIGGGGYGSWVTWEEVRQAVMEIRSWIPDDTGRLCVTTTKERTTAYMVAYDELLEKGLIMDMQSTKDTHWYAVRVVNEQGIVGIHYVEVDKTSVHPAAYAANQEKGKGFKVLGVERWS